MASTAFSAASADFVRRCSRSTLDNEDTAWLRSRASAGVDWNAVVSLARGHGVAVLVARRLREAQVRVPTEVRGALRADERGAAAWGVAAARETVWLVRLLEAAGIPVLPLKGCTLSVVAYGDVCARRSGDIDLLVPRTSLGAVDRVLAAAGVSTEAEWRAGERRWYERSVHQLVPLVSNGLPVEVHGSVHPPLFAIRMEDAGVWQRAAPLDIEAGTVRAMSPEDTLLVVCTHASRSGWARLEWAASVAWLARRGDLDWALVVHLARRMGALRMLAVGLELARVIDGHLAPGAERAAAGDGRPAALASRLARAHTQSEPVPEGDEHEMVGARFLYLRLRERLRDRARYAAGVVLRPSYRDAAIVALPPGLGWLYLPLRWARLVRNCLRAATR